MTEGPSRRKFVRALAATSGLGLLSGAGTRAFMTDEEVLTDNRFEGGRMDVTFNSEEVPGSLDRIGTADSSWGTPRTTTSGGMGVQAAGADSEPTTQVLSVGPLVSGRPRSLVVSLGVDACDPVDVWMRMQTPDNTNPRTAAVVDMRVVAAPNAEFGDPLYSDADKIMNVMKRLESGVQILNGCNGKTACGPLFLGFEWTMPAGTTLSEPDTVEFSIDVVAQQCDQTRAQNPWITTS